MGLGSSSYRGILNPIAGSLLVGRAGLGYEVAVGGFPVISSVVIFECIYLSDVRYSKALKLIGTSGRQKRSAKQHH